MASTHHHDKRPRDERKWVIEITKALAREDYLQESRETMPSPSIFMAPAPLRGLKHEAFIPQVVPIGPYHCDIGPHHSSFDPTNLESQRYIAIAAQEMEMHKIMASKFVQKSFTDGFTIVKLAETFQGMIGRIKHEYGSAMACNQIEERLGLMIALDASFVVEVLKCNEAEAHLKERKSKRKGSSRVGRGAESIRQGAQQQDGTVNQMGFTDYYCNRFPLPLRKSILQDFVMLENQIPLFCLVEVMSHMEQVSKMEGSDDPQVKAGKIIGNLFVEMAMEVLPFHLDKKEKLECIHEHIGKRKHLLDCLYAIVTHADPPTKKKDLVLRPTHFPRAVDLYHSGIRFKGVESGNMLKVSFDKRTSTLFVPKVRVGDDTERLFRNLIAYESHIIDNVHVLSYLRFMNNLVDESDDVALLIQEGILEQDIGSDTEVANMWNNLCVNTMRVCSKSYEEVATQLVKHCGHSLNMWKAEIKRTYFSRPWLVISLLSGFALLAMTLIIMVYTILLYNKDGG